MSKSKVMKLIGIVCIISISGIIIRLAPAKAESEHGCQKMCQMDMKKETPENAKAKVVSLEKIHYKHLPIVSGSIEKAIKAIETGKTKDALTELHKAQKMIIEINIAIGKHIKPKFVNDKCPIMASPIQSEKITEDLLREYKGQKVAFCCGGCPAKWDKLTEAEKDAKLAEVKQKSSEKDSEQKMH